MGRSLSTRKAIPLKHKLAAALRELAHIPVEHAQLMTADQLISLFQWDHAVFHVHGGSDEHHNLTPLLIKAHRTKTHQVDVPAIAKTKRITKAHQDFVARLLTPRDQRPPKKRWPKRKMRTK